MGKCGLHRHITGQIGKIGQTAGDLFQWPNAPQIGQTDDQGNPPLGLPERRAEFIGRDIVQSRQNRIKRRFGRIQSGAEPFGLFGDQPPKVRRAAAGAADQFSQRGAQARKRQQRVLSSVGVKWPWAAGQSVRQCHGSTLRAGPWGVNDKRPARALWLSIFKWRATGDPDCPRSGRHIPNKDWFGSQKSEFQRSFGVFCNRTYGFLRE